MFHKKNHVLAPSLIRHPLVMLLAFGYKKSPSIVARLFYGRVSTGFFTREYPYFSFNNKFRFFLTMAESNIDPVKVSTGGEEGGLPLETNAKKAKKAAKKEAKMAKFEKKKEQFKNSNNEATVLLLYTQ